MVGAWASVPGGQLFLDAFETAPPVPVEPVEISLTVNPTGRFEGRSGIAYVSGTVTCSAPAHVYLASELVQRAGRTNIVGYIEADLLCEGVTPFEYPTYWSSGRFVGGRADVGVGVEGCPVDFDWDDYSWDDCEESPCDYDDAGRAIRLRDGPSR